MFQQNSQTRYWGWPRIGSATGQQPDNKLKLNEKIPNNNNKCQIELRHPRRRKRLLPVLENRSMFIMILLIIFILPLDSSQLPKVQAEHATSETIFRLKEQQLALGNVTTVNQPNKVTLISSHGISNHESELQSASVPATAHTLDESQHDSSGGLPVGDDTLRLKKPRDNRATDEGNPSSSAPLDHKWSTSSSPSVNVTNVEGYLSGPLELAPSAVAAAAYSRGHRTQSSGADADTGHDVGESGSEVESLNNNRLTLNNSFSLRNLDANLEAYTTLRDTVDQLHYSKALELKAIGSGDDKEQAALELIHDQTNLLPMQINPEHSSNSNGDTLVPIFPQQQQHVTVSATRAPANVIEYSNDKLSPVATDSSARGGDLQGSAAEISGHRYQLPVAVGVTGSSYRKSQPLRRQLTSSDEDWSRKKGAGNPTADTRHTASASWERDQPPQWRPSGVGDGGVNWYDSRHPQQIPNTAHLGQLPLIKSSSAKSYKDELIRSAANHQQPARLKVKEEDMSNDTSNPSTLAGDSEDSEDSDEESDEGGPEEQPGGYTKNAKSTPMQPRNKYTSSRPTSDKINSHPPRVMTSRKPAQSKPVRTNASPSKLQQEPSSSYHHKLQPFTIDNSPLAGAEVIKGRPLNSDITPEPPVTMMANRSLIYHHPQQASNFMYPFHGPLYQPMDYRPNANNFFPVVKAYYMTGSSNNAILDGRNRFVLDPGTTSGGLLRPTSMSMSPNQAMSQLLEMKMREFTSYQNPQKSSSQIHFIGSSSPVESIGGGEWKLRNHNFEKPLAGAFQMAAPDLGSMQPPAHHLSQEKHQISTSNQHTTRAERENYSTKTTSAPDNNLNKHLLTINLDTRHQQQQQQQPSIHNPFFWEPNNRYPLPQQRPLMNSQESTWYLANMGALPLTNGHAYAGSLLGNHPTAAESSSVLQHPAMTSASRPYSPALSALFSSPNGEFLPFASSNFHSFASFPGSEQKEQHRLQKLQTTLKQTSFNGSSPTHSGKASPGIISSTLSLASPSSISDAFGWPVDYGSLASKSLLKVNHVAPAPAFLIAHHANINHQTPAMSYPNLVGRKPLSQTAAFKNPVDNQFSTAESQDFGNWQPLALPYKKLPGSKDGNVYTVQVSTRRPATVTKRRTLWNRFRLFRPSNSTTEESRSRDDMESHMRHKRALLGEAKKFLNRKMDLTTRRQSSKTSYIPLVPRDNLLGPEPFDFSESLHHFSSSQVPTLLFHQPSHHSLIPQESQMMMDSPGFFLDPEGSHSTNHLEPPANMPGALSKPTKQATGSRLVELSRNILKSSTRPLKDLMKMTNFGSKFTNTTTPPPQAMGSQTAGSQTYLSLAQQFGALSSPGVMMAPASTSSLQNFNQFAVPIQHWYQQQLRSMQTGVPSNEAISRPLLPLANHFTQSMSPYSLMADTKLVAPLQFNNNNTILDPSKLFPTAFNKLASPQQEMNRGSLIVPSSSGSNRSSMMTSPPFQHLTRTMLDLQPISSRISSQQLHPSFASFNVLPFTSYSSSHQSNARADTPPTNLAGHKQTGHKQMKRLVPGQRPASQTTFILPAARVVKPLRSWPARLTNLGTRVVDMPQRSMILGRDLRSGLNLFSGYGELFGRSAASREATSLHNNVSLQPETDLFGTGQRSLELAGSQPEGAVADMLDVNKAMESPGSLDSLSEADFGVMPSLSDELQSILPNQFGHSKTTSESSPLQTSGSPLNQQQLYQQQQQQQQQFLNAQQHQQLTQQTLGSPNAQQVQGVGPRPHLSKIIPSINSMASKFRQHLFQTFKLNPARWPSMLGGSSGFVSSSNTKYQLPTGGYLQSASQPVTVKPTLDTQQQQVLPVQTQAQQHQSQVQVQAQVQAQANAQAQVQSQVQNQQQHQQQQQQMRYMTQQQQPQQQHPGSRPMESQITGSYYNFRPFSQPKQQQQQQQHPQMASHMSSYGDGQLMGQQPADFQMMSNQGFHMRPPHFKGAPDGGELNSMAGMQMPESQHLDESQLIYTDRIPNSAMDFAQMSGQHGNASMEELQSGAEMYETQELMVPVVDYGAMGLPLNATIEHQYVPVGGDSAGSNTEMTDVRGNLVTSDGTYIQEETQTAGQPNQLELATAMGNGSPAVNSSTIHHHHVVVVDQAVEQAVQPQMLENNFGGAEPLAEANGDKHLVTPGSQQPAGQPEAEVQHVYSQAPASMQQQQQPLVSQQHQRPSQQHRAKNYRKKTQRVKAGVEKQSDYQVIKAANEQQQQQQQQQLSEEPGATYQGARKELVQKQHNLRAQQNPISMEQAEQQQPPVGGGQVYENPSLDQVLVYQNQQQATEQPSAEAQASAQQSTSSGRQPAETQPTVNQTDNSQVSQTEQQGPQLEYVFYRPVAGEMNATQLEQFEEPARPATNLSSGTRLVQQQLAAYQSQQMDSSSSSQLDTGGDRPAPSGTVMDTGGASQSTAGAEQYLMVEPPGLLSNQPAFAEAEPQSESNSSPKLTASSSIVASGVEQPAVGYQSMSGNGKPADRVFAAGKRRHLKTPKSAQSRLQWGQQLANRSLSAESRLDAQVAQLATTTTTSTPKPIRPNNPMQSLIKNHTPLGSNTRDQRPTTSPSLVSLSRDSFTRPPKAKIRWQGMAHQRMGNVSSASPVTSHQDSTANKTDFQLASELHRADQQAAWIVGGMTHQSFSGQQNHHPHHKNNNSSDISINSTRTNYLHQLATDSTFRRTTELNLQQLHNSPEPVPVTSNLSSAPDSSQWSEHSQTTASAPAPANNKPARTGSTSFKLSSSSSSGAGTNPAALQQQVGQQASVSTTSAISTSQAPPGRQQEAPPASNTPIRSTPPMESSTRAPSERPTVFSGAAPNSTLALMSQSSISHGLAASSSNLSGKLPQAATKLVELATTATTEPRASETTEFQEQVAHTSNYTQPDKSTQADLTTGNVINYF